MIEITKTLHNFGKHFMERRKHRRLDLQLPLHIRAPGIHGKSMDVNSVTEDVSTGGAYFLSSGPFASGMKLNISLSIPYEISRVMPPRALETKASVVRVLEPEDLRQSRQGVAIKFLKELELKTREPDGS